MSTFNKMDCNQKNYQINSRLQFIPIGTIAPNLVNIVFDFAYQMTFGHKGEHRSHRAGGTHQRKNGEIFANAFQGKLAEYALYNVLTENKIEVSEPDLSVFSLGKWDSVDLLVGSYSLSVKSTKAFGNLLLLEERDWDSSAKYLPNDRIYDYTFLIRMQPFCEDVLKKKKFLYCDYLEKDDISQIILKETWKFDIPGFVTNDDLKEIINQNYIIPRGATLNGKTRMDASNYYIQAGDMRKLDEFISKFGASR